jgi:hypothetical protein
MNTWLLAIQANFQFIEILSELPTVNASHDNFQTYYSFIFVKGQHYHSNFSKEKQFPQNISLYSSFNDKWLNII